MRLGRRGIFVKKCLNINQIICNKEIYFSRLYKRDIEHFEWISTSSGINYRETPSPGCGTRCGALCSVWCWPPSRTPYSSISRQSCGWSHWPSSLSPWEGDPAQWCAPAKNVWSRPAEILFFHFSPHFEWHWENCPVRAGLWRCRLHMAESPRRCWLEDKLPLQDPSLQLTGLRENDSISLW